MTEDELSHIGTKRHSGRYPWGSGENPGQRHKDFLMYVDDLKKKGLSETQIAEGLGITTTQLRAQKAIAKNEQKKSDEARAQQLKAKGLSNVAIGDQMGLNESSVRSLLNPAIQARTDVLVSTANMLKDAVGKDGFIDVGAGIENNLGMSKEKLSTAVAMLQEQGYTVHKFGVEQVGTGKMTNMKVLAPPGTSYRDVITQQDKIKPPHSYSEDGGTSFVSIQPPKNIDSKRVEVRYAEQGGTDMDGVIQIRRGVDDISLGAARYAQVRVAVDGSHYLKGMAMYTDDLPDGVDIRFNTNKSDTGNKLDAMKGLKDDPDNPFGAVVRQRHYTDASGQSHLSALNIVNEEGDWSKWGKTLSSQMLSKQSPALAKQQLGMSYDLKKTEFDDIMSLTNPTVKAHLLNKFADGADASAVHLKAAGLPRTASHVILPINSLKDDEIFAPNYNNGEKVVLIRHPHGGTFEIPELTVNNKNREANAVIRNARDSVGINSRVAARLSGADFDGDTVLVIPNNSRSVKTTPALAGLKDFDSKLYKLPDDAPKMSPRAKQQQMGDVSNLITDMTIKGASQAEIARAVRHSMVVIDAEKHHLDYKRSASDNNIAELKAKYQKGVRSGADTIISKAKSDIRVPEKKPRAAKDGGPIDKATGELVFTPTGRGYTKRTVSKKTGEVTEKFVLKTTKSTKMAEVSDARQLVSETGALMEHVYADHANKLKALANLSRKSMLETQPTKFQPSAKKAYANEFNSLQGKLNVALKNAPLERRAQLLANAMVTAKRQANPDMEADALKKIKGQALQTARERVGAKKTQVDITPSEWNAIQAGAISTNMLKSILDNADIEKVKQMAMPREDKAMPDVKLARAKSMLKSGYTQAEVANALGVSTSTLNAAIN